MKQIMGLIIGAGAAALAACASQPPATAMAPKVAAPAVAVPAVVATAPTPATAAAVPVVQTEKAGAIPYGYEHTVVNGKDIYCRNDLETGSRTAHRKVCYTQDQLAKMQQHTQDYMSEVQRSGAVGTLQCSTGPNCH